MFENLVKQVVSITLNKPSVTKEFYHGTLFVSTITAEESQLLLNALNSFNDIGKVQVSAIGDTGEYAYDFI
jgi:hypothetical protein